MTELEHMASCRACGGTVLQCPDCGKVLCMCGFDVLYADDGNLICTECHCESPMMEVNVPNREVIP